MLCVGLIRLAGFGGADVLNRRIRASQPAHQPASLPASLPASQPAASQPAAPLRETLPNRQFLIVFGLGPARAVLALFVAWPAPLRKTHPNGPFWIVFGLGACSGRFGPSRRVCLLGLLSLPEDENDALSLRFSMILTTRRSELAFSNVSGLPTLWYRFL